MGERCVSSCVCLLAVKAQQLVPDVVVIGACALTQKRKESPFTASAFLSSTFEKPFAFPEARANTCGPRLSSCSRTRGHAGERGPPKP